MQRDLVDRRRWISQERFLHALSYCMLLPGPEAQQLAIYIGWLLHGTWGGVVAGVFFVLPSVFILWGLSAIYAAYGTRSRRGGHLRGPETRRRRARRRGARQDRRSRPAPARARRDRRRRLRRDLLPARALPVDRNRRRADRFLRRPDLAPGILRRPTASRPGGGRPGFGAEPGSNRGGPPFVGRARSESARPVSSSGALPSSLSACGAAGRASMFSSTASSPRRPS